ncbi:hypothetical protein BDA96_02G399800 [Sorghum bicolor]|uniref:Uncharacterized protein n=1 Tax=Sorghum bicolor TaxID=4558 RepID=A0A921RTL1_SORBI|nr:uncharacterized protein LOC8079218 isoform X2 [Sorghum bicolor]KAG0545881.1 hypothetical protein BDA96_02G399800 [Sorghum bicolor]|eukprot:XP_021309948.1 uncharacterized protein LOC8079218 isoform X2 [Sorghum bicolor]
MPFREDIEKIDEYDKAMASWNTSIFHIEARAFSMYLCMIAKKGVKLASRVMDSAALRLDKQDEICSCTTKQTLAMGVAAVGHIMLQDAMANGNYVGYSYRLVLDVDYTWCEFGQNMNNLEEKFKAVSKSTKAYEILRSTMTDAMILTVFFISAVVARHERLLRYVPGTKGRRTINPSDDGEPGASGTALQE